MTCWLLQFQVRRRLGLAFGCSLVFLHLAVYALAADDLPALIADRAAVERVYYNHRTGTKPPFDEVLPHKALERLISLDLQKEAVLKKVYGVEVTAAEVAAEADRIHARSKAPEILAEIKAALGNDPARFARSVARPIVVERQLRDRFDNDDALHADERRKLDRVRTELLAAKASGAAAGQLASLLKRRMAQASESAWELGPRPPATVKGPSPEELEMKRRFGPDAKLISPAAPKETKRYLEDMPAEMRKVLLAQLRNAGDISAVIELPAGFLLFLATEVNAERLTVMAANEPKRSYEGWLRAQP